MVKNAARVIKIRTSIDDPILARKMMSELVANNLAASVHRRQVDSVYRWEGKVFATVEYELDILTTTDKYKDIEAYIKEESSYTCPEFFLQNIVPSDEIRDWCNECCNSNCQ